MNILRTHWRKSVIAAALALSACVKPDGESTNPAPRTDVNVNCGGYWKSDDCSINTRTRIPTDNGTIRINLNF